MNVGYHDVMLTGSIHPVLKIKPVGVCEQFEISTGLARCITTIGVGFPSRSHFYDGKKNGSQNESKIMKRGLYLCWECWCWGACSVVDKRPVLEAVWTAAFEKVMDPQRCTADRSWTVSPWSREQSEGQTCELNPSILHKLSLLIPRYWSCGSINIFK